MAGMCSSFTLQNVKSVRARTYAELASAPLIIEFENDGLEHGWAEISVHTRNPELTLALVEAINGAVAVVKAKQADRHLVETEAADDDRDDCDERPLTGQNAVEARWDHERDRCKHEAA